MIALCRYDLFNAELAGSGLEIRTPETTTDVTLNEIPLYVKSMGWHAVIKIPYSNAGQGVFTITSKEELDVSGCCRMGLGSLAPICSIFNECWTFQKFMKLEHHYDKFIVQALVGNEKWSSTGKNGTYYHVGTIPNRRFRTFVADIRMMVGAGSDGYQPIVVYGRRAKDPLLAELESIEVRRQSIASSTVDVAILIRVLCSMAEFLGYAWYQSFR